MGPNPTRTAPSNQHFSTPYIPDVPNDEDEVESRQDGGHEVDVLRGTLKVVVATVDRVGGG